jgi:cell division protein FtsW (lipid II flippase)
MKRLRWPLLAVLGSAALVLTDWPLGWSFWVDHPLVAAVVAGLLVVIVTVAVIDSYLRSREAKRWGSVGRIAAAEFSHVFDQAQLGLLGMLGFDVSRPRPAIETFLGQLTRARKGALA